MARELTLKNCSSLGIPHLEGFRIQDLKDLRLETQSLLETGVITEKLADLALADISEALNFLTYGKYVG